MHQAPSPHPFGEPLVAQLGRHHRDRVLRHLRTLSSHDLWLRFGYVVTDEALALYVHKLNFTRDGVFGIFDPAANILALAHLGFDKSGSVKTAEFGISVLPHVRRRGFGLRLLERASLHAQNRGATELVMTYVPENDALKRLAERAGMQLVPDIDEPRAYLSLEPPTALSLMDETFSEILAAIDLGFRIANAGTARHVITSA